MKFGQELIAQLEQEIKSLKEAQAERWARIDDCQIDESDCFLSMQANESCRQEANKKIDIIKNGGCQWFAEYATLDGTLVNAHWCNTKFGCSLRVEMPDGKVVWTTATTKKGLAKKGLKCVWCYRPAWINSKGEYFPSKWNYATGEEANDEPLQIKEDEE